MVHSWTWTTTSIVRTHPLFPFLSKLGGAGWHMFLPLAIALHTLDRREWRERWKKSPTASEKAHLLQTQLPNTACKVDLKLGVNISDLIPHLNTNAKKKNVHMEVASQCQVPDSQGESCPSCSHAAYAPVQRHPSRDMLSFLWNPKSSRTFMNNTSSRWPFWNFISGLVSFVLVQTERRRSSAVLIWSKLFAKPIFGFPNPGLHTVQSV